MPTPSALVRISASPGRASELRRMSAFFAVPDHGEAIDRLGTIDRMAAGDRDAGLRGDARATLQDLAHHLGGDLAERHAEDRQRHHRPAAHGIDVGNGVGGGDAAEFERVVDHRHEEVGGGDQAVLAVEIPHRGVVAGLGADQKLGERAGGRLLGQQFAQHRGRQLAPAPAAMGEGGQAERGGVRSVCRAWRDASVPYSPVQPSSPGLSRASTFLRPWMAGTSPAMTWFCRHAIPALRCAPAGMTPRYSRTHAVTSDDLIVYLNASGSRQSSRAPAISACGYIRKPSFGPFEPGKAMSWPSL